MSRESIIGVQLHIETKPEHEIDPQLHEKIRRLLEECFPGYPARSYFKQLPQFRYLAWGNGELLASRLLSEVESDARSSGVDAIILFADDPRVYLANGYQLVQNHGRWLMINDHETLGVAEKPLGEMMAKTLSGKPWDSGVVDLLGYLF